MAGVVMLFHSAMSRMNRTLPDAVDGESDPKTSSWRSHHGTMTRAKSPTHAAAGAEPDGGAPRAGRPPGPPAVPGEGEAERHEDQQAVVARQGRESGEEACAGESAPGTLEPARAEPERADHERLVEREVVRLDQIHGRQEREGDEHAGADRQRASAPRRRARSPTSAGPPASR